MMQRWGYDLEENPGLNYGKGVKALPLPFVAEGKEANYYQEAKRGLGYTSPPLRLSHGPTCFKIVSQDYSSSTSSWESDVSIGGLFEGLSINMVSASHSKIWKTWNVTIACLRMTTTLGFVTSTHYGTSASSSANLP